MQRQQHYTHYMEVLLLQPYTFLRKPYFMDLCFGHKQTANIIRLFNNLMLCVIGLLFDVSILL